jgi:hypothetical protein
MRYPVIGWIGLALLTGPLAPATAGPFFRKPCSDCATEVVKLPAQQIVVEATRPRVVVNETRVEKVGVARVGAVPLMTAPVVAAAPVVATIYTPAAVGVAPVGADVPVPERSAQLTHLHEAEHHALQAAKHRAALEVERQRLDATYKRLGAILGEAAEPCKPCDKKTPSDIQAINEELRKLNEKLTNLERLVHTHDNAFRTILPELQKRFPGILDKPKE